MFSITVVFLATLMKCRGVLYDASESIRDYSRLLIRIKDGVSGSATGNYAVANLRMIFEEFSTLCGSRVELTRRVSYVRVVVMIGL